MEISGKVRLHCIIPDTSEFVLFGVEVLTVYSRRVLPRRFTDFKRFQNNLCLFSHTKYRGRKCSEVIPKLPGLKLFKDVKNPKIIEIRKQELDWYVNALMKILQNPVFNKYDPCIAYIRTFFEVDDIERNEERCAIKIQQTYREYKRNYHRNARRLRDLSDNTFLHILQFLDVKDIYAISRVNRGLRKAATQPLLCQMLTEIGITKNELLTQIVWGTTRFDFDSCTLITDNILFSISQYCNPLSLKQMNLNNCHHLTDSALLSLTSRFVNEPQDSLKGGARGLQVLSISNLSKLSPKGLLAIRKLKALHSLTISHCTSASDEAMTSILAKLPGLTYLNISRTPITSRTLQSLVSCSNLRFLNIKNCKSLKPGDAEILSQLEVEISDDAVRFTLLPTSNSTLPQLAESSLRVNKSFIIQRILNFVQAKTNRSNIELLFNNKVIHPYLTLADLVSQAPIKLQYQLKEENSIVIPAIADWLSQKPE